MLPTLSELLTEKLVLVMGAGASIDYGFPLWADLKRNFLELLEDDSLASKFNNEDIDWWKNKLSTMQDDESLDEIASETENEKFKLFQWAVALIILRQEKQDTFQGWIEKFRGKYVDIVRQLYADGDRISFSSKVNNLSFISLNYDRVFDSRFYPYAEEQLRKMLTEPREYEKGDYQGLFRSIKTVIHPHGCVGGLSGVDVSHKTYLNRKSRGLIIGYGNLSALDQFQGRYDPLIAPVDDLIGALHNRAYSKANRQLFFATNCLCIGLSKEGIKKSLLDFRKIKTVYYSGDEKIYSNFVPLGLTADEIVKQL